jgi:hypothetical protein
VSDSQINLPMDLTLADFVLFVLLGSSALVVFFTFVSRSMHKRAEMRSLARRIVCRLCLHAFESGETRDTVTCPFCGAANEPGTGCRRP